VKKCFVPTNFTDKTLETINTANEIIEELRAQGYELTLRQLYYQFVARGFLPNKQSNYDRLGEVLSKARLAGLVDWDAIQDRTRHTRSLQHWNSPEQIVDACVYSYRRNKWETQPWYVEVWVEKDALIQVVQQAAQPLDVTCFSCRGYVSQTSMYEAANRFRWRAEEMDRQCLLIHLGDHDPSGVDMSRDIQDRLNTFGAKVEVRRIALTMDQVNAYNPPPNPAKLTDSRCAEYIANYGRTSWELDALEPKVLSSLIQDSIKEVLDQDAWDQVVERETKEKDALKRAAIRLREAGNE